MKTYLKILISLFVLNGLMVSNVFANDIEPDTELTHKINKILLQYKDIKPGSNRKELMKVFTTEGGISNAIHRTFAHKSCAYIKVDVEFELSDKNQNVLEERDTDIIKKISRPYLQWSILD